MKRYFILVAIIFYVLFSHFELSGKTLNISNNIDTSTGLSHNGVTSLFQDSRGYIWIGTYDGLNLYDGTAMQVYKNRVGDKIFPTNRIRTINEDNLGRVWIGTDFGVVVYNYNYDTFHTLETTKIVQDRSNLIVRKIIISKSGQRAYCITENDGVLIYDDELRFVAQCLHPNSQFTDGVLFSENQLLITSNQGCYLFDAVLESYEKVFANEIKNPKCVAYYNDNELLIGTDKGVCDVKFDVDEFGNINIVNNRTLFDNRYFTAITVDYNDDVWLATKQDGFLFLSSNDILSNTPTPPLGDTQLNNSRISSFRSFKSGDVWIGSFDKGIYCYRNNKTPFHSIDGLNMPRVSAFDKDEFIIKSNNEILCNLNEDHSKSLSVYPLPQYLENLQDKHIVYLGDNEALLFTVDATYYVEILLRKVTKIQNSLLSELPTEVPRSSLLSDDGIVWLGYRNDLIKMSLDSNKQITAVESIRGNKGLKSGEISVVRSLFYDKEINTLWVGTNIDGLYRIELNSSKPLKEQSTTRYCYNPDDPTSLTSNFVSSIIRAPNNTLWIGTEQGGLCRAIEQGDNLSFRNYSENEGLSNNVVKSIQVDDEGNLWIATNIGLSRYSIKRDNFRIYSTHDGLPFQEFRYSSARGGDGTLYFSGANSVCYFNPQMLNDKREQPKVHLRSLKIYDKEVKPGVEFNERIILPQRLENGATVKLKYNENVFSFHVDALYDKSTSSDYLYYKLEPINSEWIRQSIKDKTISFNGLNPGKYQLLIKASTSSEESYTPQVINIEITPRFWRSIWGYAIYILISLVVIVAVIVTLMKIQRLHYKLRLEQNEKLNIKRLNEEKQRYFSNISHELRTPLTLIIAPLSLLGERFKLDVKVRETLFIIQRQAKKMLHLIEVAHSIELDKENLTQLNPTVFTIRDFIADIANDFEFFAQYAHKQFRVEYPPKALKVCADSDMLEKVFNNLLNNAFKHTSEGDEIVVCYTCNDDIVTIKVSDSGRGIAAKDLPHVFERFYTVASKLENNIGGTGIGLAYSKSLIELHSGTISVESIEGKGTTFIVKLPILLEEIEPSDTISALKDTNCNQDYIVGNIDAAPIAVDVQCSGSRIFIVEDNDEMREFLADIIGRYYKISAFPDPKQALKALDSDWPELILSDVMMPEMSGTDFCAMIKNDIRLCHIPVILLTALNTIDDKIKGLELCADAYIEKPFYPKYLITRIDTLLRSRRVLQKRFTSNIPTAQTDSNGLISSKDNGLIERLYKLFDENLDNENIDLDGFATSLGLNRTTFYAKIKALTSLTPNEVLKNYRLQRAAEMLRSGEYNVNDVYYMTGFKDRSHFSRLFKAKYDITPGKYQKMKL